MTMKDDQYNSQKPVKPPGTISKTEKGPHGGGNKYVQSTLGTGFLTVKPIKGHTQKQNIGKEK